MASARETLQQAVDAGLISGERDPEPKLPLTPMLDKALQSTEERQVIGQFLEWQEGTQGAADLPLERQLAAYFDLDENQMEREREMLIDYVREHNDWRDRHPSS